MADPRLEQLMKAETLKSIRGVLTSQGLDEAETDWALEHAEPEQGPFGGVRFPFPHDARARTGLVALSFSPDAL